MPSESWGKCKDCKMWQIEPEANIADRTMGVCVADELETYRLRVSGNSGSPPLGNSEAQGTLPDSSGGGPP